MIFCSSPGFAVNAFAMGLSPPRDEMSLRATSPDRTSALCTSMAIACRFASVPGVLRSIGLSGFSQNDVDLGATVVDSVSVTPAAAFAPAALSAATLSCGDCTVASGRPGCSTPLSARANRCASS